MFSLYRRPPSSNTNTRKRKTSNYTEHVLKATSNDLKMTSKNTNENGNKVKSKNILRGGDPNDDNPIIGRVRIEQAFSSQKMEFIETLKKF